MDLNEALHQRPDAPEVHYVVAKLHQAQGEALSYRQGPSEALRLNPWSLGVRLELVQFMLDNKANQSALDLLDAAPEPQTDQIP